MNTMTKKINLAGVILSAFIVFGCEKSVEEATQSTTANRVESLSTISTPPCKGKCCAFSQGYWFAKPNVVWPGNLQLGDQTYTKAEGQALWDAAKGQNNTPLLKAFFQAAAIKLSGTPITNCSYPIALDVSGVDNTLKSLPKITTNNLGTISSSLSDELNSHLQAKAGRIGEWIDANHCE